MKSVVIGTTNKNKVERIRKLLLDYPIKVLSLEDIGSVTTEPQESAKDGLTIAAQKALGYVDQLGDDIYVLTQDDTVIFSGIDQKDNPGLSIKTPVIEKYGKFTDENAIQYYSNLAKKYGGSIDMSFHYGHSLAYIRNDGNRRQLELFSASSVLKVRLVQEINRSKASPGYFFRAVIQLPVKGKWVDYYNLTEQQVIDADQDLKAAIVGLLKKARLP